MISSGNSTLNGQKTPAMSLHDEVLCCTTSRGEVVASTSVETFTSDRSMQCKTLHHCGPIALKFWPHQILGFSGVHDDSFQVCCIAIGGGLRALLDRRIGGRKFRRHEDQLVRLVFQAEEQEGGALQM